MFDLESGGEEQSAENNKKERKWGKENKKEEVQVLGNTVQMERAVVAKSRQAELSRDLSSRKSRRMNEVLNQKRR